MRRAGIVAGTAALLLGFCLALYHLTYESFWFDEAWTAWAISDPAPASGQLNPPDTPREIVSFALRDVQAVFNRIRADDVHPPLYYLLLNGWAWAAGEGEFSLRYPSVLWLVLALAAAFAWAKSLGGWPAGLAAAALLGTSGFVIAYGREARMYTQFLALALLMAALGQRWRAQARLGPGAAYGLVVALLLLTHYVGALLVLAEALLTLPARAGVQRLLRWAAPFALGGSLAGLWLPFALGQLQARGQPAALPLPTDLAIAAALIHQLTSQQALGMALLLGAALLLAPRWPAARVLLWGLLPALALLLLNTQQPVFQLRYVIFLWGAGAVVLGWAVVTVGWRLGRWRIAVTAALAGVLAAGQLWNAEWLPRSDWRGGVLRASQARQSTEPAVISYLASSPAAYYDRWFGLRRGISVDVGWRSFTQEEIARVIGALAGSDTLWLIAQASDPVSWQSLAEAQRLGYTRLSYAESVNGHLFYRLSRTGAGRPLALYWRLDDQEWPQPASIPVKRVPPGEGACALAPQAGLRYELSLIAGYNQVLAQNASVQPRDAGELCLEVPTGTPPGTYTLRLRLFDAANGRAALLLEHPPQPQYWGDFFTLAVVVVPAG
jgi:hypothetical protein